MWYPTNMPRHYFQLDMTNSPNLEIWSWYRANHLRIYKETRFKSSGANPYPVIHTLALISHQQSIYQVSSIHHDSVSD